MLAPGNLSFTAGDNAVKFTREIITEYQYLQTEGAIKLHQT